MNGQGKIMEAITVESIVVNPTSVDAGCTAETTVVLKNNRMRQMKGVLAITAKNQATGAVIKFGSFKIAVKGKDRVEAGADTVYPQGTPAGIYTVTATVKLGLFGLGIGPAFRACGSASIDQTVRQQADLALAANAGQVDTGQTGNVFDAANTGANNTTSLMTAARGAPTTNPALLYGAGGQDQSDLDNAIVLRFRGQ